MSYSRWIDSDFYTYWCGSSATKKEDELFACHYSLDNDPNFSYTEVNEIIRDSNLILEKVDSSLDELQIEELLLYMRQFIAAVDQQYFEKLSNIRGGQ